MQIKSWQIAISGLALQGLGYYLSPIVDPLLLAILVPAMFLNGLCAIVITLLLSSDSEKYRKLGATLGLLLGIIIIGIGILFLLAGNGVFILTVIPAGILLLIAGMHYFNINIIKSAISFFRQDYK